MAAVRKIQLRKKVRRVIAAAVTGTVVWALPIAPSFAEVPMDQISSAKPISTLPFSDSLNTSAATTAADDPSCAGRGATIWYILTPADSLTITANTFGSNYDTTLSAYTGSPGSLTQIRCNDDAGGTLQSSISFDAVAHTTYYLMVGSFGSGPGGSLNLTVDSVVELIANTTSAYYNDSLGTVLDGTGPQFLCANIACGDPFLNPLPEPDRSPAFGDLGNDWLSANPLPLNSNWTGPQPIPLTWAVNTETAILYEIDAGPNGLENVVAQFGVDNGIFVWLDGVYKFGATAPFGAFLGEYVVDLGNLTPGLHYLQVLREDHGGATGYAVRATGRPVAAPAIHETMTSVTCTPNPVLLNGTTACTGIVTDESASPTTPTGTLEWTTNSALGHFDVTSCTLAAVEAASSSCTVQYTASQLGPHTISVSYSGDGAHASSSDDTVLRAICQFSGFLNPIDDLPTVNEGKGGRTYPVKFQCQDANGVYLTDLGLVSSILSKSVDPDDFSSDQTDAIETASSGNSVLRYDAADNQFVYNWQTPGKGWYVLFVNFADGQTYQANFELK